MRPAPFPRLLRPLVTACLLIAALITTRSAHAQLGRAGQEFFAQGCGFGSCNVPICGHQIQYNSTTGTITIPDLGVTNVPVSLNGGQAGANAQAVANALNVYCGASAGDSLLATGGSTHMQGAQVEGVARALGNRGSAAGGMYGAGGVGEISSTTYGASIPLDYAYRINHDAAFSTVGFVNFAHAGAANQGGVSASPAYAWEIKNAEGKRLVGVAGYVPLSFALAQVDNVPNGSIISWGAGGGALATGSLHFRATDITYGGGAAARMTAGGFAVPLSLIGRIEQPLDFAFHLFSTFASVSYGNDFLNAGSEVWSLATGAALGKYEFGYRGFYGNAYVAHTIGFSIRKDIEGAEIFERQIPQQQEPYPKPPTQGPTGPILPTGPVNQSVNPPPGPAVSLPPPPEVPQGVPAECQSDMDCPGDQICEEARCLPPL